MKIIFEKKKKKKGLWANIHAKRERGESPSKPGEEEYPDKKQWNKLTKEELEQLVTEEIEKIFEEEDPKAAAIKSAKNMVTASNQKKRAAQINQQVAQQTGDSALANVAKKETAAAIENEKYAKQKQKDAAESTAETPEQPVTEEKSNFQKEMQRKGKGWKVRLLTKGKQPTGSAYPNKAPTERAKSAPPGAGGV
jgi:hypothetical protein